MGLRRTALGRGAKDTLGSTLGRGRGVLLRTLGLFSLNSSHPGAPAEENGHKESSRETVTLPCLGAQTLIQNPRPGAFGDPEALRWQKVVSSMGCVLRIGQRGPSIIPQSNTSLFCRETRICTLRGTRNGYKYPPAKCIRKSFWFWYRLADEWLWPCITSALPTSVTTTIIMITYPWGLGSELPQGPYLILLLPGA